MADKVQQKSGSASSDNSVPCAVLSYFIVGIIWFFADEKMRQNSFVKFHVKQALVFWVADIIFFSAISIIGVILSMIPFFGFILGGFVWAAVYIAFLVIWIIGIINSATGKEKELPIFGGFAEKINF